MKNWRDTNMTVTMPGEMPDGMLLDMEWPPEAIQKKAKFKMNHDRRPKWRDDPTYNLRRAKQLP